MTIGAHRLRVAADGTPPPRALGQALLTAQGAGQGLTVALHGEAYPSGLPAQISVLFRGLLSP